MGKENVNLKLNFSFLNCERCIRMGLEKQKRNAVVLVSGGADSIPLLYYVVKVIKPEHTLAIHVDYGQRMMEMERFCVTKNIDYLKNQDYNISLEFVNVKWLGKLSTSKLVRDEPVPETPIEKIQDPEAARERILWWWDVVRNLQLITIGLAYAESFDLQSYLKNRRRCVYDVYIGIRRETPVPMKDNTPEFVEEMNHVAEVSTHFGGYKVYAPFISLDKHAIIRLGTMLDVKWEYTFSCYTKPTLWIKHPKLEDKIPVHCGRCSNCRRRHLAFIEANIPDPTPYEYKFEGTIEIKEGVYIDKTALQR